MTSLFFYVLSGERTEILIKQTKKKKKDIFFLSEQNRGFASVLGVTTVYSKVFVGIIHE